MFKSYPKHEPSYNGTNYLTIIEINKHRCFAFKYFNHDAEWELKENEIIIAFSETNASDIILD